MTQVSVAQFTSTLDMDHNVARCIQLVDHASESGADVVVLPEAAMYPPPGIHDAPTLAQELDGPFVTRLLDAAARRSVHVVAGMFRPGTDGRVFNTLVSIGREGSLVGTYDKIHLYDAFTVRESDGVAPGLGPCTSEPPHTFEIGGLRFGLATCYDLRFPELFRSLVDAGVTAFVLPAAWYAGERKLAHWRTLLGARAIENTSYMIAANQCGDRFTGHSTVVDPRGEVIATAGESVGIAAARLDPNLVDRTRESNPCLRNRRFTTTFVAAPTVHRRKVLPS